MIPAFPRSGSMDICLKGCTARQRQTSHSGSDRAARDVGDSSCAFAAGSISPGVLAPRRLLIDGSFVTAKQEPDDVDAVILLPKDFQRQVERGIEAALDLEQMLLTRSPEELFAAEDEADWDAWIEFFGGTREMNRRRKGLVEVQL